MHCVAATSRKFEEVVFNIVDVVGQHSPHKLQMIQGPTTKNTSFEENASGTPSVEPGPTLILASASAEEGLVVQIALEMARSDARQSAAEEANVAARSKLCVLLQIRASEYGVIKLIFCYIFVIYALRTRRFSWEEELIGAWPSQCSSTDQAHIKRMESKLIRYQDYVSK